MFSAPLLAAIGLTLAVAPLSAAERLKPGMWRFTTTSGSETHTFKRCLKPEETDRINGDTKADRGNAAKRAAGDCTLTEFKVEGMVVTYAKTCGNMKVRNTTTYHGDTFEVDITTKTEGAPEVSSHMTAKRLGICPIIVVR
jgi:hypothetical protein